MDVRVSHQHIIWQNRIQRSSVWKRAWCLLHCCCRCSPAGLPLSKPWSSWISVVKLSDLLSSEQWGRTLLEFVCSELPKKDHASFARDTESFSELASRASSALLRSRMTAATERREEYSSLYMTLRTSEKAWSNFWNGKLLYRWSTVCSVDLQPQMDILQSETTSPSELEAIAACIHDSWISGPVHRELSSHFLPIGQCNQDLDLFYGNVS